LIDGDNTAAAEQYHQQISARPGSTTSWTGLALATGDESLSLQPELVFQVHQEIRVRSGAGTDPVALARWLA
jgi:hypothetical protein